MVRNIVEDSTQIGELMATEFIPFQTSLNIDLLKENLSVKAPALLDAFCCLEKALGQVDFSLLNSKLVNNFYFINLLIFFHEFKNNDIPRDSNGHNMAIYRRLLHDATSRHFVVNNGQLFTKGVSFRYLDISVGEGLNDLITDDILFNSIGVEMKEFELQTLVDRKSIIRPVTRYVKQIIDSINDLVDGKLYHYYMSSNGTGLIAHLSEYLEEDEIQTVLFLAGKLQKLFRKSLSNNHNLTVEESEELFAISSTIEAIVVHAWNYKMNVQTRERVRI